ncbi:MAG TPA: amidohydrolase/deacetylase family metallohydrolase, partial [Chloroflexota bacterium]|nr:amidohydrolase/deacetylase family metallohydrolase [Chloroflexota bacterium]
GRIAAIGNIPESHATRVIDVSDRFIIPGLVDLHVHAFWGSTFWGIDVDPVAARTGVTTSVDAGSAGAYNWRGFRHFHVERARSRLLAYLNISSIGVTHQTYEHANLIYDDIGLAVETAAKNRDVIVGIKVRLDHNTTGHNGTVPMDRSRLAADALGLPIMVHIGSSPPPLHDIISRMKPGDVLTHCFTGNTNKIVEPDETIRDDVKRAWDRGLILDVGHGAGSFSYPVAEAMLRQDLLPDCISTDIHVMSIKGPMFDMPTTLSKFLNLGMSLSEVVERATINPAKAIGRADELGSLAVGRAADVAVLELVEGNHEFKDVNLVPRQGSKRLFCLLSIMGGEILDPELEGLPL